MKLDTIVASKVNLTSSLVEKNDIGIVKKINDAEIEVYFIRVSSQVKMSISQVVIIGQFEDHLAKIVEKILMELA